MIHQEYYHKRSQIAGIDTLTVDPHNEVLPLWYELSGPAVMLLVDDHPDDGCHKESYFDRNLFFHGKLTNSSENELVEEFAKEVSHGMYISVAVHDRKVGVFYHINPRTEVIIAHGKYKDGAFVNQIMTIKEKGGLKWDPQGHEWQNRPIHEEISINDLVEDLKKLSHPLILNTDFDAFQNVHRDSFDTPYMPRIQFLENILIQLPTPQKITNARSQNPNKYVHEDLVDNIQRDYENMLKEVYLTRV